MSVKTEVLFSNNWNVRISDPGEEGASSHFFEKIYITLEAHIDNDNVVYEFTRKVEDQVKINRRFTDLNELFKFLGDYLDPVSMGFLGVKIGALGQA
ncbi:dithiol-disulfide isomerase [[Haemophilus] felis]|uniref:Dithiol-disulfide isomerase n=1 Tax=[Haemophilus] felis TaxID=123822 RepID=A0A1T0BC08_9PAST|nr:dithiol-disulfide isomerase [[Haemophilus] felis]NBI40043.1 dithiol-disulfide isomerase [[Haemophilus] felis]NBI41972.1 dithiol-disulfide isomerase [[Haemophilus] felis]OOS07647.1 dithiol-disulfide isomerase [[Haemophilus] felis]